MCHSQQLTPYKPLYAHNLNTTFSLHTHFTFFGGVDRSLQSQEETQRLTGRICKAPAFLSIKFAILSYTQMIFANYPAIYKAHILGEVRQYIFVSRNDQKFLAREKLHHPLLYTCQ